MSSSSSHPVALITGITGQDGSYLAELLLEKGYEVHGIVRRTSNISRLRIDSIRLDPALHGKRFFLHYSDLIDATTLRKIFIKVRPTEFYHLAGQSHVGLSFEIPESTCHEIASATLGILEICRDLDYPIRMYHAASSEIFGAAENFPQTEQTPYRPTSPYGCAKAFAAQLCDVYRASYQMFICNGILYNHESPRRGENFVTRKIVRQAAKIKAGLDHELILGNLESQRDWGHARDYVQAMWMMLQHSKPDNYIVSTGNLHSVQDWVRIAFEHLDLDWTKYVKSSESLMRPQEPTRLLGNPTHIQKTLGWKPQIPFEKMVAEMVESDLKQIQNH
ncbi:MAG: GDP-mannose 4,6-dehydratase [Verrucomicrobiota bacterium]